MAKVLIRWLNYIETQIDRKLAEAFNDVAKGINNLAGQVVANPNGEVQPPVAPTSLTVAASGGVFDIAIYDNNPVARGIQYFVEYSTTAQFSVPYVISLGPSRNHRAFLGNLTLYFRAYAQYPTSAPSDPVYFGSVQSPTAVVGGGSVVGPTPLPSAGSGTASSNGSQGGSGFGKAVQRT